MRVLVLGDIIGKPGRMSLRDELQALIKDNAVDFVIANGENAAGGIGIDPKTSDFLLGLGIDLFNKTMPYYLIQAIMPPYIFSLHYYIT